MTYRDFIRLRADAHDCADFESFVVECGGSVECDDPDLLISHLRRIWDTREIATFRELRKYADITQREMSRTYGIPQRSVENWDEGSASPSAYLLQLLLFAVLTDDYYF